MTALDVHRQTLPKAAPGPNPPTRKPIMYKRLLTITLLAAALVLPATPALASAPANFGTHVRDCAQTMGFSGTHNPGMHHGAAGWDGQPCQ